MHRTLRSCWMSLMKALSVGSVRHSEVASLMQRNEETASRLVAALLVEGLCQTDRLTLRLPD